MPKALAAVKEALALVVSGFNRLASRVNRVAQRAGPRLFQRTLCSTKVGWRQVLAERLISLAPQLVEPPRLS